MCNTWLWCDVCPSLNIQHVTYCKSTTWKCAIRNSWLWCDVCPSLYIQYVTYCNFTTWKCAIRAFAPTSKAACHMWMCHITRRCDTRVTCVSHQLIVASTYCECETSHVEETHMWMWETHVNVRHTCECETHMWMWDTHVNVSHYTLKRHTCECVTSHVTCCGLIMFSDFQRVTSHVTYCNFNALTRDVPYRVPKTHRTPNLYRSFSAKEP